jgi:catechol 2,3-dioxygenase
VLIERSVRALGVVVLEVLLQHRRAVPPSRVLVVVDRDQENTVAVIRGGNATIYVSDMQRAVDFYRDTLELALVFRAGDHWAELDAGGGLYLGLHPASAGGPAPGTRGGITVGFAVDEPIAQAVETLKNRGVIVDGPVVDEGGLALAFFTDPDGNPLYLAETANGGRG